MYSVAWSVVAAVLVGALKRFCDRYCGYKTYPLTMVAAVLTGALN